MREEIEDMRGERRGMGMGEVRGERSETRVER